MDKAQFREGERARGREKKTDTEQACAVCGNGALSTRRGGRRESERASERASEGRFKSYPRQWVASRQTQTARQVELSPCPPACLPSPLPSFSLPRGRPDDGRIAARPPSDRPIHPIHSGGREREGAKWKVPRYVQRGRSVRE